MKYLLFLFSLSLSHTCFAQIKLTRLDAKSLPKTIQVTGKIVNAVRWVDNQGENIVVTTETDQVDAGKGKYGNDSRSAALYAYHYLIKSDTALLTWKLQDFVKQCEFDIMLNYIDNTFSVTDLNKDGNAEVWLMYRSFCTSDVSPGDRKIVMYEIGKKYAVRGKSKVQYGEKEFAGGEYSLDDAFKKGPEVFRQYATQLWKKNIME